MLMDAIRTIRMEGGDYSEAQAGDAHGSRFACIVAAIARLSIAENISTRDARTRSG